MQASFKKIGLVGRSQQSGLREVLQQMLPLEQLLVIPEKVQQLVQ